MIDLKKEISKLSKAAAKELEKANSLEAIDELYNKYLGRKKGKLNDILKELKSLDIEIKKEIGPMANELKIEIETLAENKKNDLRQAELKEKLLSDKRDLTLPLEKKETTGHYHPLTLVQREIEDLFRKMGFLVLDGPELESEFYNFDGLNVPDTHPAREDQDTFWLDNGSLLRSQTSSVQVRAMREHGAPLRCIVPGRVFRNENIDASHEHTFSQLEGVMIGKNISVSNLIAMMKSILGQVFGKEDMKIRLRPGYFPFVEPGFEMDMECTICDGKGCSVCKQSGWIEILPCGMIHPNVLEAGGIDSKENIGFAFGLGLSRLVMMKYKINDIRLLTSDDLRFLNQF